MALKDTCKTMRSLLECIQGDLEKAEAGNKAAAQRVRTCSIKFEKAAKLYRKESIKADKTGVMKKVKAARKKTTAPKKHAPAKAHASRNPAAAHKKVATARKRPTAKLPKARRKKK
jgi:Histone H1-like protein Hc1